MELNQTQPTSLPTIFLIFLISIATICGYFFFAKTFKKSKQSTCNHEWIYMGSETITRQGDHRLITVDDYKCILCGLFKQEIR